MSQMPCVVLHLCARRNLMSIFKWGLQKSGGVVKKDGSSRMVHLHYMRHDDPRFIDVAASRWKQEVEIYLDPTALFKVMRGTGTKLYVATNNILLVDGTISPRIFLYLVDRPTRLDIWTQRHMMDTESWEYVSAP